VFTAWYRALREAVSADVSGGSPEASGGSHDSAEAAYRSAAARLDGAGMPGLERGLLPLALLGLRLARG
ncbi:hypothetical protein G3I32_38125, partial [Streptomyces coelicoflavus]|nr:hypothetical protein [Streptomyces coelicoflavus]